MSSSLTTEADLRLENELGLKSHFKRKWYTILFVQTLFRIKSFNEKV